jgi:hypothetical protein
MLSEKVMMIELLPDTVDALGGNTSAVTRYPEDSGSLLLFLAGFPQESTIIQEKIRIAEKKDLLVINFSPKKNSFVKRHRPEILRATKRFARQFNTIIGTRRVNIIRHQKK